MNKKDIPSNIKTFTALGVVYNDSKVIDDQVYTDCIFCGGKNKFYLNIETKQWDCKSGSCLKKGNLFTFINEWYKVKVEEMSLPHMNSFWESLSNDRKISVEILKKAGLVYDFGSWYIPVLSSKNTVLNFRKFIIGKGLIGMPGLNSQLYGLEYLENSVHNSKTVVVCEGEWDVISSRTILDANKYIVVGAPGAGIWKEKWSEHFLERNVIVAYDNDAAGEKGLERVYKSLKKKCKSFKYLEWPSVMPEKYDMRDFISDGGDYEVFVEMLKSYTSEEEINEIKESVDEGPTTLLSSPERPTFEDITSLFKNHLHFTKDMEMALRIIFAVVLSNQIEGDPLWVHIVSPPGTAKTELLMPLGECLSCYFASTLTAHSLVSGFITPNGNDPSLLPKLNGKTFVLKDFTEILSMPKTSKDEIYSTLRGAYDGSVRKEYGNGMVRDYNVRFNMISGVTHSIFGERGASLGERFLLFHLVKGVGFKSSEAIRSAIKNVGKDATIRHDLSQKVKEFVEVKVCPDDIPDLSDEIIDRIVALSSIVSMLRASVDKVYQGGGNEKLLYRPQHEMGTRLGKQLTKLAYGLSLVNSPPSLGEDEYKIVCRVALDTCVGFNLEAVALLVEEGGKPVDEISERLSIPLTTLRDQMDDLTMLGVVKKHKFNNPEVRGAPKYVYFASEVIIEFWKEAQLSETKTINELAENRTILKRFKKVKRDVSSSNSV